MDFPSEGFLIQLHVITLARRFKSSYERTRMFVLYFLPTQKKNLVLSCLVSKVERPGNELGYSAIIKIIYDFRVGK